MRATHLFKAVVEPCIGRFEPSFPGYREVSRIAATESTRHTSRPVYSSSTTSCILNSLSKSTCSIGVPYSPCAITKWALEQRYSFSTVPKNDGPGTEWKRRVVGCQPFQNLKVGPYKRGKWFVSYKDDPGSFITNILILLVTGYSIFTMMPGKKQILRIRKLLKR